MAGMVDTAPNLYLYIDYRRYLADTYTYLKRTKPQFSYRYFARQAGFSAPNYLKLVVDGQRNLTPRSIKQFAKALKLEKGERDFFHHLVMMNQARSEAERNEHYQALSQVRGYLEVKRIERDQYAYYSNWYVAPIRELVGVDGFRADPAWIAAQLRPEITPAEAEDAVALLIRLGFVLRDEDGLLRQAAPVVSTGDEVRAMAVRNFHRAMLQRAGEAIDRFPVETRQLSGLTVAISPARAVEVAERLHALRRALFEAMCAPDDADETIVYQVNLQLFPLTQAIDGRGGES